MNKRYIYIVLIGGICVLLGIILFLSKDKIIKNAPTTYKVEQKLNNQSEDVREPTPEEKKAYELLAKTFPEAKPITFTEEEKKYNELINNYEIKFSALKKDYSQCFDKDYDIFLNCITLKVPENKIKASLTKENRQIFKKDYYRLFYSKAENIILYPTVDPVAIEVKKNKIKYWIDNGRITSEAVCNKLLENEVRQYCKKLMSNR